MNKFFIAIAMTFAAISATNSTHAADDAIWEFSPYHVKVWIAYDSMPHFSQQLHDKIARSIARAANVDDPSGWTFDVERAPADFRYSIVHNIAELEFNDEDMKLPAIQNADKLILVSVKRNPQDGWNVVAREFDCKYEMWSRATRQHAHTTSQIDSEIYTAIRFAFVPLARITDVDGERVTALMRAGGLLSVEDDGKLIQNEKSPVWISVDAICEPIRRRSMRIDGKTRKVTMPVDWTYTHVNEVDTELSPVIKTTMYSARRAPLGGRRGTRTERVLRVVKPNDQSTKLFLTNEDKEPKPVIGYEIRAVLPNQKTSKLLGKTGMDGSFTVHRKDHPLLILYVKSGTRLLARLPVVPGFQPELTAKMYGDEVRLRAEGVANGLLNNLLRQIAFRESLIIRIRVALKDGKLKAADGYLRKLGLQKTASDFKGRINAEKSMLVCKSPREKERIDAMFNSLTSLAGKHIKSAIIADLKREFAHMKDGGTWSELYPDEGTEDTKKEKDDGEKDDGEKDDGEKDDGEKDGGEKDGGEKDGKDKDGGEKDGKDKDGGGKDKDQENGKDGDEGA